ncbi:MAG: hypothetical protein IPO64_09555 [Bacteroidetes bacterium]|nr:hypothetical protein [Bacteroidota bacterium]
MRIKITNGKVRSVCSPTLESAWTTPITAFLYYIGCSFQRGIDAISNSTDAFTITWNAVSKCLWTSYNV